MSKFTGKNRWEYGRHAASSAPASNLGETKTGGPVIAYGFIGREKDTTSGVYSSA